MDNLDLTGCVIGCAMEVHRHLGPGLLEAVHEECLCEELSHAGIMFARQVSLPLTCKGKDLGRHFQVDLIIQEQLVVEAKALTHILPVHEVQLQSCLRLSGLPLGLLLNFNEARLKDGIRRRSA
jgi:GxxExxY protein